MSQTNLKKGHSMRGWHFVLALALIGPVAGFAAAPPAGLPTNFARLPPKKQRERIDELIRMLGSDDYESREKATRSLLLLEAAVPALRRAGQSTDPETRRRARAILATFSKARRWRALEAMKADARAGRADLLAERIVRWDGAAADPGVWQPVFALCWHLLDLGEKRLEPSLSRDGMLPRTFRRYEERNRPLYIQQGNPDLTLTEGVIPRDSPPGLLRGANIRIPAFYGGSMLAASNFVELDRHGRSFVLAGGPVRVNEVSKLVVICDGDFEVKGLLAGCVVVARGAVRCPEGTYPSVGDSVILAGGDVSLPRGDVSNCLIRAAGKITLNKPPSGQNCVVKQNDSRALSCVRFFRTTDVGLEVSADKGGLRAAAVEAGPFAKAELKAGDVLVSFDGKDLDKADAFRRHLRRKVAEGGEVELRVRRDGKPLTLAVRFD